MRCPNCGKRITKDKICENCKIRFVDQNENNNQFFYVLIIAVTVLLLIIVLFILNDKKPSRTINETTTKKELLTTLNIGTESSYNFPSKIGNTVIASYYDGKKYYTVDVKGIKYLEEEELSEYPFELKDGFVKYGFVYNVKFNELGDSTNLDPVLESEFRFMNGNNFVSFNETKVTIETKSYYNGPKLKNGESADVVVLYSVPEGTNNYSICLGNEKVHQACFQK